ncbi:MAG TPA: hypothetical protein VGD03_05750 [Frankiaceae bacterium]
MPNRGVGVLFVDAGVLLSSHLALAAALRRAGVRVERLTAAASPRAHLRAAEALVFHATHRYADPADVVVPPHLLASLVDIQTIETVHPQLPGPAPRLATRLPRGADDAVLFDKYLMGDLAARQGWTVPRTWLPAELADGRLPEGARWPLIVKQRTGFGGDGLCVVATPDELVAALLLPAPGPGVLVQQFTDGDLVKIAGMARDGRLLQWGAYRSEAKARGPYGSSSAIAVVSEPGLVRGAERLLGALRYSGPFGIDCIRGADGTLTFLELNSRIWGSWPALDACGLDLVSGYLQSIGVTPVVPRPRGATPGAVVAVPAGTPEIRPLLAYRQRLGLRWGAAAALHTDLTALGADVVAFVDEALRGRRGAAAAPQPVPENAVAENAVAATPVA